MRIIFFLLMINSIFAQSELSTQFEKVNSLFDNENYFDAVTEGKRLLFFDSAKTFSFQTSLIISNSYKMGGFLNESAKYAGIAEQYAANKDEYYIAAIQRVRVDILRRGIESSLNKLDKLDSLFIDEKRKKEITYWRGWALMFDEKWNEAAKVFSAFSEFKILEDLSRSVDNEKYSSTFAKAISYIVPGSGLIYTGEWIKGIISLGWNALWIYTMVNAFQAERIFDGIMVGNFLWFRFYRGSLQNTDKYVILRNIEISNKAYKFLKNDFNGEKP